MPLRTTPSRLRLFGAAASVLLALSLAACGDDDNAADDQTSGEQDTGAATTEASSGQDEDTGDTASSGGEVFPENVSSVLDEMGTTGLDGGGTVGAGLTCTGNGGDVLYAGASGVDDGVYRTLTENAASQVQFTVGPDGVGYGAVQGTFEEDEYVVTFLDLDEAEVTLSGCGG